MSKAILLVDMSESCEDCELCRDGYLCLRLGEVDKSVENGTKDLRCPLKQLPEIKEKRLNYLRYLGASARDLQCYAIGHDDCIDEILGEENE